MERTGSFSAPSRTYVLRAFAVELLAHLREHVLMPKVPVQPGRRLTGWNTGKREAHDRSYGGAKLLLYRTQLLQHRQGLLATRATNN